jgi:hypothetical protein
VPSKPVGNVHVLTRNDRRATLRLVHLEPDLAAVVAAMPAWEGRDVRAEVLGGGITNRNFRVDVGDETFVVRLSGKDTELLGIDRDAERLATKAAHEAGVAPEVVAFLPDHRALVTRFVEAKPLPPEDLERQEVLIGIRPRCTGCGLRPPTGRHSRSPIGSRSRSASARCRNGPATTTC